MCVKHIIRSPQARRGGALLLDPDAAEEGQRDASALMALMPSCNEVTQLEMQGEDGT